MSNNKENFSSLLEDKRIKKELSNRYGSKRYWTFLKGIRFFLPVEYRNSSFPLSVIINDDLFDCMKQDVEPEGDTRVQRLITFNSDKDAEQIVADINETNWSKSKKGTKLSFDEIQEEKRRYFCSKIRIKPEILICYILDHIDLFSSEVEIPPKLKSLLSTIQETPTLKDNNFDKTESRIDLQNEIDQLLKDVVQELENLYDKTKHKIKKINAVTAEAICEACKEAYMDIVKSSKDDDCMNFIELKDIDCSRISNNTEKLPRELKGQILYNLIFRKYQNSPKTVEIPTNYQGLYDYYNKQKKETKK